VVAQVTCEQFRRFVESTGYQTEAEKDGRGGRRWNPIAGKSVQNPEYTWRSPGFDQTDRHPVVQVSWNDALAFCDWLSQQEGQTYRLPTEAEWERACRAGTTARYCFGDDAKALGEYAWYSSNSYDRTHAVGEKKANGFGLYDMHGNVWEWCWDGYDADYYKESPVDDPQGPARSAFRMMRGGGKSTDRRYARSAARIKITPVNRGDDLGFRVARV
jgi:formylglycine-generating enzyme required for sulfatase activity